MRSTAGFTLQHVQFLVVDEADRLLRQAYQERACALACAPAWPRIMLTALAPQDWLPHVLAATSPSAQASLPWGVQPAAEALTLGAAAPLISAQRLCRGGLQGDRAVTPRTVKLVVSATLTRDPSKIGRLELYAPLLLTAAQDEQRCVRRTRRRKCAHVLTRGGRGSCRYQLAPQLRQWRVVVPAEDKPRALLVLLRQLAGLLTIVFASSVRRE